MFNFYAIPVIIAGWALQAKKVSYIIICLREQWEPQFQNFVLIKDLAMSFSIWQAEHFAQHVEFKKKLDTYSN